MPYARSRAGERSEEDLALYVFARCEQFCEDYARSHEINAAELTRRVANLFQAQAGGESLGAVDHLSSLRRQAGAGSLPVAEVEVAGGARSGASNGTQVNGHRADYGKPHPENVALHDRIRKMILAGMSRNEIAEALRMTITALSYHVRAYHLDNGAPPSPTRRGPAPGETKNETKLEKIRKMLGSGMTRAGVAKTMGMTKDGVGYWVRQYKLEEPVTVETDTIGRRIGKRTAYTKKNPHWTQRPENRARVEKWMRKMKRMKNAKA